MPSIEELMDAVCQTISEKKSGEIKFSTMDLTYSYRQLPLSQDTSLHCNFIFVVGISTGMYRFETGFYDITTKPADF